MKEKCENMISTESEKIDQKPTHAEEPPQPPVDLSALRLVHGNNFGISGYAVTNYEAPLMINDPLDMKDWEKEFRKRDLDPKRTLNTWIEALKANYADYNSFKAIFGRYDAKWAVRIGENLLLMKDMVKKAGFQWEPWAGENISFMGKRNRQRMMYLAKRKDCHKYDILGVDRLEILCASTADSKDSDPIGNFMIKHKIVFDPTQEFDLGEFKAAVDTALNNERLIRGGVQADPALVKDLTVNGIRFDKSFVNHLKEIKDSGGDPNIRLKTLSMNKGQGPSSDSDEVKRLKDFNSLSNRLIQTIDYIVKDEDQIEMVDSATLQTLMKKLKKLQKLAMPAQEQAQSA